MSLLERILASKRSEVARARAAGVPARSTRSPLDVRATLTRPSGAPVRLIAEVKLRSPSAGPLSRALAPEERALAYAESGAAMVSVLCDGPFFDGSFDHLARARARLDESGHKTPLLAKEFIVDEVQLDLAAAHGADAALLIARIVSPEELARLAAASRARGLEPLVEITDEQELTSALAAGARVIGVNARDLDTLVIDVARAARVLGQIPPGLVAVHLSGLKDAAGVQAVAASRADAALLGEALMREHDPRALLRALVGATA